MIDTENTTVKRYDSLGTVITYLNTPDIYKFHFVMNNDYGMLRKVKVGKYVSVKESSGFVIGQIMNLFKINEYFLNASTLKESRTRDVAIQSIFPVDQWEYQVAEVDVVGFYPMVDTGMGEGEDKGQEKRGRFQKSTTPVSPGNQVSSVDPELLENFLGFNLENGLHLGEMEFEDLSVKIDLTRLVQKHFAILAMSGAGKSYLTSVILEELIKRKREDGRIATIIVDTHGEYSSILDASNIQDKFKDVNLHVVNGSFIQIGTPFLSLKSFFNYLPKLSHVQGRELFRIFKDLRNENKNFDLRDLVKKINDDESLGKKTKEALAGWLFMLDQLGIFSSKEFPFIPDLIKPGNIVVLDLSGITSMKHKQIIVDYFASRAFFLRKNGSVPPYTFIIEEAHQFIPQASASNAIASNTIETLAREGRKFFASLGLISQRPVHLNTTILSQCNSQFILKVSNPYDLDHIRSSSEKITRESLKMISSLPVGYALVVGSAVNVPVFFKVREREFLVESGTNSLIDVLKSFDEEV
ncbi:MAG: ATP-binding protein [Candidatus Hodarchaeota archaeon]